MIKLVVVTNAKEPTLRVVDEDGDPIALLRTSERAVDGLLQMQEEARLYRAAGHRTLHDVPAPADDDGSVKVSGDISLAHISDDMLLQLFLSEQLPTRRFSEEIGRRRGIGGVTHFMKDDMAVKRERDAVSIKKMRDELGIGLVEAQQRLTKERLREDIHNLGDKRMAEYTISLRDILLRIIG